MADDITLEELLKEQDALNAIAAQMIGEHDVDRIQALGQEMQRRGAELSRMAQALADRHADRTVARGTAEVVLRADQRQRILDETGVDMPSLIMPDHAGIATRTMPSTDPQTIEFYAMKEARRIKAAGEAEVTIRQQIDEALRQIEEQGTEALREQLEELKADPNFLGGALKRS